MKKLKDFPAFIDDKVWYDWSTSEHSTNIPIPRNLDISVFFRQKSTNMTLKSQIFHKKNFHF